MDRDQSELGRLGRVFGDNWWINVSHFSIKLLVSAKKYLKETCNVMLTIAKKSRLMQCCRCVTQENLWQRIR